MASPSRQAAILSEKFPDNISISELCDCGNPRCFAQQGRRHKRRKEAIPKPRRLRSYPDVSDYRDTFKQPNNIRPRSSKRPPPSPRDPNPPAMVFSTNQREDFRAPRETGRPPDYAPKDVYEAPSVPLEKNTFYSQEFTQKKALPDIRRFAEPRRENFCRTDAKFDGRTTYKEKHKHWVGQKQVPFGELPSFVGSILFPSKEMASDSETKQSFQGEFAKRPDIIRLADAHIKMEGDHNMMTTNMETYKDVKGDHRPSPIVRQSDLAKHKPRGKFQSETQFRHDFPGYTGGQPKPPPPAQPAPDTLDLKFDNARHFETEQRKIYKGHDVIKNPVPKSCKLEDEYVPPSETVDNLTSNMRDYRPIDLSRAYISRAVVPVQKVQKSDAKFDGHTSTKEFFRNWGASPRVRYGDFHENRPYIPPQEKFAGESVAQSSFTPKKYQPTKDFRPEDKPVNREGDFDFNTVTHMTYQKPEVKPCRAAVYLMQQELKRQRQAEQQASNGTPTGLTIAAK
ncbi:uncharacterized protein LOC132745164 isoform X1 [Ruditapes philippinarum]|uniref:uncharacterized protein LOC132745164 isoform X1 n=1 Tax=Ruditapes philippinarum TaxID=129788 RepID=UPI00295B8AAD|nr:uncharacterized protein LOC132745164 isoform X1 [Ruditapes philippinarum]